MKENSMPNKIVLILYPVVLYFAVSMLVMAFLGTFLGDSEVFYTIRQAIGAVVTIPFLRKTYRMDAMLRNKKPERYQGIDRALRFGYAALVIGMAGAALNNAISLTSLQEISEGYKEVTASFYGTTFAAELVCLGIIVPFAEELMYRGVVYGRIRDFFGTRKAIFFSALIFGIVHLNLVQFLYAFLMGLFLAWFTEKYHSFLPAFFGHALANCISIFRQEFDIFGFMEKSPLVFIIWTVVLLAVTGSLFSLQFKVKKLA